MKNFDFAVDADGVAIIRINVPARPMNLIGPGFIEELALCVDRLVAEPGVKGAVISSGKPGSFVAGADVKDFLQRVEAGITPVESAALVLAISQVFRRIETCGKPVAAALNGLALGGGLELALSCHHRVLGEDPKHLVGLPEVKLGLLPGAGGTQRLPRLIGLERALPILLEGRLLAPSEALLLGVVDELAPPGREVATARAWVLSAPEHQAPWDRKGFAVPGGAGPLAVPARDLFSNGIAGVLSRAGRRQHAALAILSCVYEGTITGFDTGLRIESKYFATCMTSPVAADLMREFVHKR